MRCEEKLKHLRILHLRTMVRLPYMTDALGNAKAAKESWRFGKTPAKKPGQEKFPEIFDVFDVFGVFGRGGIVTASSSRYLLSPRSR